jgi:hypothetical protein
MKEMNTAKKDTTSKLPHKQFQTAEYDFVNIENRLKELKELEKKLLSELKPLK